MSNWIDKIEKEFEDLFCEFVELFGYEPNYCKLRQRVQSGPGGAGGPVSVDSDFGGGYADVCIREQCYPCSSPSPNSSECNGNICKRKENVTNLTGTKICSACEGQLKLKK